MAESRSVMLNLIGNNRTSRAFRGAADDADRLAGRLDRADASSGKASKTFEVLTGRAATLASGLLAVAPAAGAAAAAAVAGAGAMAAAYGSAAAALGAFRLAVQPQLEGISEAAKAAEKAQAAQAQGGKAAAEANKQYAAALAQLPPATRATAKAFIGLKQDYKAWSDSLAGDTMPIFTRGLNVARKLLPKLTPLVKTAAGALSDFMGEIEQGSKSKGLGAFLGRINEAAKKTLPALLRSAKNVGVGIAGIFDAFLPHAGAMAMGVEGLTRKFAEWGKSLKDSEGFKEFIDYIRKNLPALKETFGNLVQIVVNLATAFAPMTGISLMLVKNFSAMLAALPPPVVTALATAFVAASTAARIWTPIQAALNLVLSANPIGLVVLAIAGLVAGLVLAYKKSETFRGIVNGVWAGVKGVVGKAWTGTIKPALDGLGGLFSKAAKIWEDRWPAMQQLLGDVAAFFDSTLLGAIDKVTGAFGKLGGSAEGASGKIAGVGQGFKSTEDDGNKFIGWSNFAGAAIGAAFLGPLGSTVGYVTVTFWPEMKSSFKAGFKTLSTSAQQFSQWLPGALRGGFSNVTSATATGMRTFQRTFFGGLPPLRNSWSGLWNWMHAFLKRIMGVSVAAIRNAMSAARRAFSDGVAAIRSAWGRLPDGVKRPINWVINQGYNNGIRALWNKVMGWLHLPGGLQLGRVPALASGGTLANPAPARPFMTSGPTAIVGEGRQQYPEFVIPTDPKFRGRAQALWAAAGGRLQMLAKGGVLGSVLGTVKKIAGKISGVGRAGMDLLANPRGVWDRLAAQMVPSSGHLAVDSWGTAMSKVVPALLNRAWQAASPLISTFKKWFGGDASGVVKAAASMIGRGDDRGENNNWLTRAWNMPGAPWCAMFVSEAIKQAHATKRYKGYPSAAVASYVAGMRHVGRTEGRPGDLGAYRGTGHINVIAKNLGNGIYETIGGNEGPRVKRSVRGGQSAILRPMARGGILDVYQERNLDPADGRDPLLRALRVGVFDSGGMLAPKSATLAINKTPRWEPIFPSFADAVAYGGRGDGPLVNIERMEVREEADVDLLASRLGFAARAAAF